MTTTTKQANKKIAPNDRIAILGARRGLGWALYQELVQHEPNAQFFLSSRKIELRESDVSKKTVLVSQDFSKTPVDKSFLQKLQKFNPTRLIYTAGGGPYGEFHTKNWADHKWAFKTSFLYPAELLHHLFSWSDLSQIVFIGSAIAEDKPDRNAASYAASKHALKGLISTVQAELGSSPQPEVILFSPGYMQTDMLPPKSGPRAEGLAEDPHDVAKQLIAVIEKNNQR